MDERTLQPRPAVDRAAILAGLGGRAEEIAELLRYTQRPARPPDEYGWTGPVAELPDEPFVAVWSGHLREAQAHGVWPVLRRELFRLRFDIRAGRSAEPAYLAATRSGVWPAGDEGLTLSRPETLSLHLQPTAAGQVPVLFTSHRDDFVALTRALAHRNEPFPVPETQRACLVAGHIHRDQPDTLILLGGGPYSAVPAAALGLADEEWERLSLVIRAEHECAHYVVRRFLGRLSRRADDELLADFVGLSAARGHYSADWALRFLGLEDLPLYRPGGRLENYRGSPSPLSDAAFFLLAALVHSAAHRLEEVLAASRADLRDPRERTRWLLTLTTLTLEELAAPQTSAWLATVLGQRDSSCRPG